jgi:hypothetical protein
MTTMNSKALNDFLDCVAAHMLSRPRDITPASVGEAMIEVLHRQEAVTASPAARAAVARVLYADMAARG